MKSFFIVTLLLMTSCFHSDEKAARELASLNQHSCKDYFLAIIKKDINEEVEDDLLRYINRRSSEYWDWHENVTRTRVVTAALKGVRMRLIRILQNFNRNQIPVIYIGDKDESLITISKIESIYEKNLKVESFKGAGDKPSRAPKDPTPEQLLQLEKEAHDISWKRLNLWIEEFKEYPVKLGSLTREYLSLSYNLSHLRRIHRQDTTYPVTVTLDVYSNVYDEAGAIIGKEFKKIVEPFPNREALRMHMLEMTDQKKAIEHGSLFIKGSRRELELEHAQNARRLRFVYDRVKSAYLTAQRSGTEMDQQLVDMYLEIEKLLFQSPELAPSPNIVIKLEGHEINKEIADAFKIVSESSPVKSFREIYKNLTERERARLQLDERSPFGRAMQIVANNRYIQLGIGLAGTSAGSWFAVENYETWLNLFLGEQRLIDKCVEKEKDSEFNDCMKDFLMNKFKFERNPFLYLTLSPEALLEELKGDMELRNDFIGLYNKILQQRADWFEEQQAQAEIERELEGIFEDIITERKGDDGSFVTPRSIIFNPIE